MASLDFRVVHCRFSRVHQSALWPIFAIINYTIDSSMVSKSQIFCGCHTNNTIFYTQFPLFQSNMDIFTKYRNIHYNKQMTSNPFPGFSSNIQPTKQMKGRKEKRPQIGGIPRQHKPGVQRQGHRVQEVQAEPKELGQQKLDNQKWRRCPHNSG